MLKVIRVNTRTQNISVSKFDEKHKTLGQRGLIARVMTDEVDPKCDPLGSENKAIICTGMLAGTMVTTAHRLSVGGKSPLTGGIKEANSGGIFATMLSQHGIKMIVLEDVPSDNSWKILMINPDGQAELINAVEYVGLNNYALTEKLHKNYGENIGVLSIGIAGEKLHRSATLQVTDFTTKHPVRSAARGGLGAVFGSKKIKAVVIKKANTPFKFPYADKEVFLRGNTKFVQTFLAEGPHKALAVFGTVGLLVDVSSAMGLMPVNNFSGRFCPVDKLEKINSKAFKEAVERYGGKTGVPCQAGCLVKCSNTYYDEKGRFITSGLEYETYALAGPNCDITDIDFIAKFDQICDDYGVDTIEAGCTLGVMMDAGRIAWGDVNGAMDALHQMVEGKTELGEAMSDGTAALGKYLGAKRIPTVKNQAFAAYDPRNLKGVGVTYATSPMGADHTAGLTLMPGIDHTNKEGKVNLSREAQFLMAACDNMMCSFAFTNGLADPTIYQDILKGALGIDWNMGDIIELGKYTIKLEHEYNLSSGLTAEDDRLPDFIYTEPSPATNSVYDIMPEELQEVYNF